jgi:hypothetical protein
MDERLSDAIALLARHPWLSHVYNLAFLESARGGQHLAFLLECFAEGPGPIDLFGFVGNRFEARMARLSRASQKRERLARIEEFFHTRGVGSRTLETARDVSEELLTNAFYDAPAAARVPGRTMSRIHDVALPRNRSCEIVYGMRGDLVFVRVRDSFGSLTRERLVSVLRRCALAKMQVALDDGAGGAGLGLWRIFARASFVVVVVRPGHESEFLVGIARRAPSKAPTRPVGINLFFISPVPDHRAGIVDLPLDRSVPFLEQGGRTR